LKKKLKKEAIEWVILIAIISSAYFTGWHKPLLSMLQRGILEIGIFKPKIEKSGNLNSYDLSLMDKDYEILNLSKFKNEVIFINLWATWCPPCIAEMPDINGLYNKMGDKVNFVMISLDKEKSKALNLVKDKEFDFPVYFPISSFPEELSSSSIPTTFVINKKGEITVKNSGMAKYNTEDFINHLQELAEKVD